MPQGIPYVDSTDASMRYQGVSGTPGILVDGYGNIPHIPLRMSYQGLSGIQTIATTTYTSIGSLEFNPSQMFAGNLKIARSFSFRTMTQATAGVSLQIRLYNLTLGSEVVSSVQTIAAPTNPTRTSSILTFLTDLPNSFNIYSVQMRISTPVSPGDTDRAFCQSANIIVDYSSIT